MGLNVAVQMDPIESIDIAGDSTFRLMLEGQARGHDLWYYRPESLHFVAGEIRTAAAPVEVMRQEGAHFRLGAYSTVTVGSLDAVLMRQDPPFDMAYITYTHMLEQVHPTTLVVNDPAHVRNAPEKIFVTDFPQFMPPTLITRDMAQIRAFRAEHGDVILKPLFGNGGAGIVLLRRDDPNLASLIELYGQISREPIIVQRYLPEVRAGDKRIILVDGKVAGAINRIPAEGEARSNMHVGGRAEPSTLTAREHEICEALGPVLKERGLIFVGIDVIGDWLTEINVTSPTGLQELERFDGINASAMIWEAIEARCG